MLFVCGVSISVITTICTWFVGKVQGLCMMKANLDPTGVLPVKQKIEGQCTTYEYGRSKWMSIRVVLCQFVSNATRKRGMQNPDTFIHSISLLLR